MTARVAVWQRLLVWMLGADEGEAAAGDLQELYAEERLRYGRFRAGWQHAGRFLGLTVAMATGGQRPLPEEPQRGGRLGTFVRDLRFGLRGLRQPAGVTAVLTLGAGIGITTVVFALVWQTVLRPLPFPAAAELDWVGGDLTVTQQQFDLLAPELASVTDLTALTAQSFMLTGGTEASQVAGLAVSTNHFEVFGVAPYLGRALRPEDGQPGAEPVVYLGYDLWRTRFGADSAIVGTSVQVHTAVAIPMEPGAFSGKTFTVVGVLPPGYRPFGNAPAMLTPLITDPTDDGYANMAWLSLVGRRSATTRSQDVRARLQQVVQSQPEFSGLREPVVDAPVMSLQDALVGPRRTTMLAAFGAALLILLTACANVVTLLLVRLRQRDRELAIRRALGATRSRMVGQLLAEGVAIGAAATGLGIAAVFVLKGALLQMLPADLAISLDLGGMTLLFASGAMVLVILVSGLFPALGLGSTNDAGMLTSRSGSGSARLGARFTQSLVALEMALALVVTYAAFGIGLSLARVTSVELGFVPEEVSTLRIVPAASEYSDADLRRATVANILEQARAVPGVVAAGAIHFLPIADAGPMIMFRSAPTQDGEPIPASYRVITPGYLEAMQIAVRSGRPLNASDVAGGSLVGLVNESMARQLWPESSAVGQTLYRADGRTFFTVVGVVADVRQQALSAPPEPEIYLPLEQTGWASAMSIVVRSQGDAPNLRGTVREIIRTVDPNLPVTRSMAMTDLIGDSVANDRLLANVFAVFALLALGLGGIGVFAIAAAAVAGRQREIGIRLAVGATGRDIARHELQRSGRLAALGIGLGLVGVLGLSRVVAGLLYDVAPLDRGVLLLVVATQLVVVTLAAAIPTWRAVRVDPTLTLRRDG